MNLLKVILQNDVICDLLQRFINDCHLGRIKISTHSGSLKQLEHSFTEYINQCDSEYLENTKPGLLIYNFLTTRIDAIDDKNLLRILHILQLIDPTDQLAAITSREFQIFKNKLRKYFYSEPEPYNAVEVDEDFEEPQTPIDGLPSTTKLLFIPEAYLGQQLCLKEQGTASTVEFEKPALKIDTQALTSGCQKPFIDTPVVVLDTSFLDI